MTIFELQDELRIVRQCDADAFGVSYKDNTNNKVYYVIMRSEREYANLKLSYKDWDYSFNRLVAC